ncbi:leukocyte receptor cluster member 8 [Caerostris extrusa]|uniref:Leukocyte receptor cluster member 8 n=1 Tax=Caerostris extrusa TaxID=172846 RepID=A0AAV4MZI8_CAEEX|nr:leukocyte receptor cluster member 8 [Caerostris extrusa]
MAQWPFVAMSPMANKPPMPVGIPEEWQKANQALQAVQVPKTTEASSLSAAPEKNESMNDYSSPFPWQQQQQQQQPPMFPTYPQYTGYPPPYGYYNYNYGYMMNNNPYYVNTMPPSPSIPSSLPSTPVAEDKPSSADVEKNTSENTSAMSLPQPPPPPQLSTPKIPTSHETNFYTGISNQAPNSGGIKFNLPKKNVKTAFQTTRQALQERMNNFRNGNSPLLKERNILNQSLQDVASSNPVSVMSGEHWPASLKNYVAKCFDKCETNLDKDQVELILKGKLMKANNDGTLKTKDWDNEPLPSTHSDRLKQEQAQTFYQKLHSLKNPDKKMSPANERNFQKNRINSYRSRSRSRSRSYSRSKSRSRSPSKKVFRRRKYSSSSDSSEDSRGSKKTLSSSVIGPSEMRSIKSTPNSVHKNSNKKKKKKGKQVFTVEPEFCTDERLLKRAARFETKNGKSPKANMLFTICTTPLFTSDEVGTEIEWGSDAVIGTCQDLEKPFLRLTGAVDPTGVRPEEVLKKSLAMVKDHWIRNQDYHFACEQLKSIRQDLVVQCVRNRFTVDVYETHARIALEKGDHTEFNQCQSQLKVLFREVNEGNRLEFTGYHILYTMYTENAIELKNLLTYLKPVEKQDEVVSHALKLAKACSSNNYCRFFKLYISAPKMSGFIIDWFIDRIRKAALKAYIKSFRPNIPISFIQSALAFPTANECMAFLIKANLVFADSGDINCKESVGPLANF